MKLRFCDYEVQHFLIYLFLNCHLKFIPGGLFGFDALIGLEVILEVPASPFFALILAPFPQS